MFSSLPIASGLTRVTFSSLSISDINSLISRSRSSAFMRVSLANSSALVESFLTISASRRISFKVSTWNRIICSLSCTIARALRDTLAASEASETRLSHPSPPHTSQLTPPHSPTQVSFTPAPHSFWFASEIRLSNASSLCCSIDSVSVLFRCCSTKPLSSRFVLKFATRDRVSAISVVTLALIN